MQQKLKQCQKCKKDVVYYKDKQCLSCYKCSYPEKFQIKKADKPKPIPKKPIKKTPLKKTQKKISKFSEKQIVRQKMYQKLRDEYMKIHNSCERCGTKDNLQLHHKKGRGQFLLKHFCVLCFDCHSWAHLHSKEAEEQGFIFSRIKKDSNG